MIKKNYTGGSLQNTVYSPSDDFETVKLASNGATQSTSYYYTNDQLIAKKNPDGSRYYYHNDHLGSDSVMTDSSGALYESTSYDPWGEIKTGGTKSKFLYTGQENDPETGLDYYNARYYNPHVRRFTQPDSFTSDIYNPQDLNEYSYVLNNPLRYTDPSGHCIEDLCIGEVTVALMVAPVIGNAVTQVVTHPEIIEAGLNATIAAYNSADSFMQGDYKSAVIGLAFASINVKGLKSLESGQEGSNLVQQSTLNAEKAAASQRQMQESGKVIAGPGSKTGFRDASKIVKQYGGKPTDWAKKTSSDFKSVDKGPTGKFQTHWVENVKTGFRILYKTVFTPKKKR